MTRITTRTSNQLDELVDVYNIQSDGMKHYLHIETGEILMVRTLEMDHEDMRLYEIAEAGLNETYFLIPQVTLTESSGDIYEFTKTIEDTAFREQLQQVLRGRRNVFRKYKDLLLSNFEESERYYAYVQSKSHERMRNWLESIGVQVVE